MNFRAFDLSFHGIPLLVGFASLAGLSLLEGIPALIRVSTSTQPETPRYSIHTRSARDV